MKVGDTAEVIEITDNSRYPTLYNIGNWGVVDCPFSNGNCAAIIGLTFTGDFSTWYVDVGTYRKVGKLTVTKVK